MRRGEIQAKETEIAEVDKKKFKDALTEIKELAFLMPDDFIYQLQSICARCGVALVFTQNLPKAPISGATRWFLSKPLIQLSGRFKTNDHFWFTFFHEAGHILLHGKKDIFLENIAYSDKDNQKEKEADGFAIRWTLSKEEQNQIMEKPGINEDDIVSFAKKFNTHPAIIIGRLQHDGHISHALGRRFFEPVDFE